MTRDQQPGALPDHKAWDDVPCARRPLSAVTLIDHPPLPLPEDRFLRIASIRTDGGAQHRIAPDPNTVKEYAELMRAGVKFPPIPIRYDQKDYWPSDGFQRLAAAKLAGFTEIGVEVRPGTKEDAQWDSYAANATHGLRRTVAETEKVIRLALQHPNAGKLSSMQMAKHLHIPLTTLCRYREKLIFTTGKDSGNRIVTRGDKTYEMDVHAIGKKNGHQTKLRRDLRADLAAVKEKSSPTVRILLNIIEHWVLSPKCDSSDFLAALEKYLWAHRGEFEEPPNLPRPNAATAEGTSRRQEPQPAGRMGAGHE